MAENVQWLHSSLNFQLLTVQSLYCVLSSLDAGCRLRTAVREVRWPFLVQGGGKIVKLCMS